MGTYAAGPVEQTLSANGNTVAMRVVNGGHVGVQISGTFGSGTAKIQSCLGDSGGTYSDVKDASYTTATSVDILAVSGEYIRVNLAGATNPSLNVIIKE